jgi:hypothetical protein
VIAIAFPIPSLPLRLAGNPSSADSGIARLTREFRYLASLANTSLWWIVTAVDAIQLVAKAAEVSGSSSPEAIIGYWNTLEAYPGLFGSLTDPTQRLPDR